MSRKFFEKLQIPRFRPFVFAAMALFVLSGAVNNGVFGIFPALPMIAGLFLIFKYWGAPYRSLALATFSLAICLFVLRTQNTKIFYPATGRVFYLNEDSCFQTLSSDFDVIGTPPTVMAVKPNECSKDSMVVATEFVKKDTEFVVDRVDISHADFGESYSLRAKVKTGELNVSCSIDGGEPSFRWENGDPVKKADFRRWSLYLLSLLMYWPVAPFLIFSVLKL